MKNWTDVIGKEKEQPYFQHALQQVHLARANGKQFIHHKKRYLMHSNIPLLKM